MAQSSINTAISSDNAITSSPTPVSVSQTVAALDAAYDRTLVELLRAMIASTHGYNYVSKKYIQKGSIQDAVGRVGCRKLVNMFYLTLSQEILQAEHDATERIVPHIANEMTEEISRAIDIFHTNVLSVAKKYYKDTRSLRAEIRQHCATPREWQRYTFDAIIQNFCSAYLPIIGNFFITQYTTESTWVCSDVRSSEMTRRICNYSDSNIDDFFDEVYLVKLTEDYIDRDFRKIAPFLRIRNSFYHQLTSI